MSNKRFYKDHNIDGWPIIDSRYGERYGSFDKDDLIDLLNDLSEKQNVKNSDLYKDACKTIGMLEDEIARLNAKKLTRFNDDECWIFNPDECSHPNSLVCPVVMSADDFRSLLKQANHWQCEGCEDCNHGPS